MTGDLVRSELIAADVATAEESLRRVVPNARVDGGADLRHRLRLDGDDWFTVGRIEFAGVLTGGDDEGGSDTFTVARSIRGDLRWEVGDQSGAGSNPWLQRPGVSTIAHIDSLTEDVVFLRAAPLAAMNRAIYGDDDLRMDFDGAVPVDDHAVGWLTAALDYASAIAPTESFGSPLVRLAVYRSLAIAVLEGFRLTNDVQVRRATADGRLRQYRQAAAFLDDNASLPVTAEDAAKSVGVSTRQLNDLFLAHSPLGITATGYLRRARYTGAHDDLVSGDPTDGVTVRQVSARWGFGSQSRFARGYREIYGAPPRWTLDR